MLFPLLDTGMISSCAVGFFS